MPDKTVKLRLKVKDRKRLRRLSAATGVEDHQVIEWALKVLERTRRQNSPASDPSSDTITDQPEPAPGRFRIRCEIEGEETVETLEQLQGIVNEIVGWLHRLGVAEEALPVMMIALGAQCIREGERSQRFLDERQARREE
jgi:hypothetical protein